MIKSSDIKCKPEMKGQRTLDASIDTAAYSERMEIALEHFNRAISSLGVSLSDASREWAERASEDLESLPVYIPPSRFGHYESFRHPIRLENRRGIMPRPRIYTRKLEGDVND